MHAADDPVDNAPMSERRPDIRAVLEEQKERFAEQAARLAKVFRRTGEALEAEDRDAGRYARWVGDQADRVSSFLGKQGWEDVAETARGLATRKNLLMVGGAAALGYLCYRIWRGSGEDRPEAGRP